MTFRFGPPEHRTIVCLLPRAPFRCLYIVSLALLAMVAMCEVELMLLVCQDDSYFFKNNHVYDCNDPKVMAILEEIEQAFVKDKGRDRT